MYSDANVGSQLIYKSDQLYSDLQKEEWKEDSDTIQEISFWTCFQSGSFGHLTQGITIIAGTKQRKQIMSRWVRELYI